MSSEDTLSTPEEDIINIIGHDDGDVYNVEIKERLTPVLINDITEFYNVTIQGTTKPFLDNMVALLCCVSCQEVRGKMKKEERYEIAYKNYTNGINTYLKKSELNGIVAIFSKENVRAFPEHIKEALQNFLTFRNREETELQIGKRIWDNYEDCRTTINNHVNKLWRVVKSGENQSTVFTEILEKMWPIHVFNLTTKNFCTTMSRYKNDKSHKYDDWVQQHSIPSEKKKWIDNKIIEMNNSKCPHWRPKYWLTFFCMGNHHLLNIMINIIVGKLLMITKIDQLH